MEQAPRFTKGNDKLRKKAVSDWRPNSRRRHIRVFNFNLRAIHTCPGRTPLCESYCYADAGRYRMLRDAHDANRTIADEKRGIIERTENLPAGAWLRIHTSGDFYNGCELAAFPESAGFGYFRRIAPPIRAVSFSPVLARQMWRLEEGDALRVSIVDGFAQFEPGVYYWED